MVSSVDFSGRPFHFIGVGGIGMSALAQILAERQLPVSGSDIRLNHITQRLETLGVHIFSQQAAVNLSFFESFNPSAPGILPDDSAPPVPTPEAPSPPLPPPAQVVCSTAINPTNAEYQAALDLGCPIFHRSDILAALIRDYKSIAVSGTHGKTTTSALIGYLLTQGNLDPTVVIGGEVNALGGNARLGSGTYLVAEADESDGSLIKFSPYLGVITNIELDHPDHYNSLQEVIDTFTTFSNHCTLTLACLDCATLRQHFQPDLSYSLDPATGATYTVTDIRYQGDGCQAQVWERGICLGELTIGLLGSHNLSNALAAVAVGRQVGLSFETITAALATFEGAKRRFEYRGSCNGIALVDDYAHHPSEIQMTLAAARLQVQTQTSNLPIQPQRIIAVFQPHRYSRTEALLSEFAKAFGDADVVLISDVYSAGEAKTSKADGAAVATAIGHHHSQVNYCPALDQVVHWLSQNLYSGDLVLFLGAGNLNQIIPTVLEQLQQS
ncbi:UDP-N-acetylmuramate--L-alanine ligase [Prochlorothrix hollandica]|uniref:UDP-N-acetylmuramate--L-alanine ligase n=2 Tax=Prochlorothrix hollandica TaxID=1223 RepID=A0A0M2PVJ0_PROHO|nr:UDP-N-acetylmuramate--L-alanine ligase [Prochlorothrix hollandica]KKI99112.1 UDP-N-acetylmuramate--alanine ligase [Prochlorothrix hollandica PCC 9006 = CALU 1027]